MRALFLCLLLACDASPAADTAGAPRATVAELCDKALACGGFGWQSRADCEAGWLDSAEHGTTCADADAYLACTVDCLALDCEAFATCDNDCWSGACRR